MTGRSDQKQEYTGMDLPGAGRLTDSLWGPSAVGHSPGDSLGPRPPSSGTFGSCLTTPQASRAAVFSRAALASMRSPGGHPAFLAFDASGSSSSLSCHPESPPQRGPPWPP